MQTVDSMTLVQTTNGKLQMRVVTANMQRFENDSMSVEVFRNGMNVFAYTEDGSLESTIVSDEAVHEKKKGSGDEIWKAYGNVVVKNIIKQETMETDTLYWDRTKQEVYTDCYVKIYSPDGFMQGYGMRSDDRMKNATLYKSFNNFVVVEKDTTAVMIDSVNFIGPFPKKIDKFAP